MSNPLRAILAVPRGLWRYWRIGHDIDGRCPHCGCLRMTGCGHGCPPVGVGSVHPGPDEYDVQGREGVV